VNRLHLTRAVLRAVLHRDWPVARMWLNVLRDSFKPLPF
jgi:hypothetical protein